jgi:hypothetical protein
MRAMHRLWLFSRWWSSRIWARGFARTLGGTLSFFAQDCRSRRPFVAVHVITAHAALDVFNDLVPLEKPFGEVSYRLSEGMEMVSASFVYSHVDKLAAEQTFTYVLLYTFEEFLEMTGVVIFVNGLLLHLTTHTGVSHMVRASTMSIAGGKPRGQREAVITAALETNEGPKYGTLQ